MSHKPHADKNTFYESCQPVGNGRINVQPLMEAVIRNSVYEYSVILHYIKDSVDPDMLEVPHRLRCHGFPSDVKTYMAMIERFWVSLFYDMTGSKTQAYELAEKLIEEAEALSEAPSSHKAFRNHKVPYPSGERRRSPHPSGFDLKTPEGRREYLRKYRAARKEEAAHAS